MVNAWGGFSNGQIPLSAMLPVQGGNYFEPSTAAAMEQLLAQAAAQGVNIHINEGYRPLGEPNDQNITDEYATSTGSSNQWFQVGRVNRGETPSAGTPGTSSHGWGMAADINPGRNNDVVRNIAESLGFVFTVASESWHISFGGSGGGGASSPAISAGMATAQQILANVGLYSGAIDGIFGPKSWTAAQTWLAKYGLYDGAIDGVPGPKTYKGVQLYGQKNGNYAPPGVIDGVLGPLSWAGFAQSLKEDTATPTPAPTPAPEPTPETPAKPVEPEKPTTPTQPSKPTKPVKEPAVTVIAPLPTDATNAGTDALGILIPNPKGRKLAYALYGLAALVISNLGVAVMASGTQAPVWLIVASAVVGNLAVPFTTLAIANAGNKK
ncbi:Peptidase M15B [uncultured Caudovirales phage]|uniref:Peptidase M15B n=1 Tax=uncultured Caudovirales phage TaxID=2100421 RepID=A0A6J7WML0_9CAUD|nr:Peptidase M15B [uncultured Caudovirales phage]